MSPISEGQVDQDSNFTDCVTESVYDSYRVGDTYYALDPLVIIKAA
jgi:hypothetical protein